MDLSDFQGEHAEWLRHNFPDQKPHDALLGLAEEVGELAHAHLKYEQGIRGYDKDQYRVEAADAIGDVMIYLASYCTTNGFDLRDCLDDAWWEVKRRDWRSDPETGAPSNEPATEVRGSSDGGNLE